MSKITERTVAVITTGGTVGAAFGAGMTVLNHDETVLRDQLQALSQHYGLDLHTFPILDIFSEDMQPHHWGLIMQQIEACLEKGYTQIIITHGTDTMEYSVTAAGLYFGDRDARICFTGAFLPPSAPQSDARLNIEATLTFLISAEMPTGVYVVFSENSERVALIRAHDLMPMSDDQTSFSALYGETVSIYTPGGDRKRPRSLLYKTVHKTPLLAPGSPPTAAQLTALNATIFPLACYPGMDLNLINFDRERPTLLILGAYHSGTAPTSPLCDQLEALAESHPNFKAVAAMHPARYIESPYETTAQLTKRGRLTIYRDLQPHQIYVLATCLSAQKMPLDAVLGLLAPWRFDGPALA